MGHLFSMYFLFWSVLSMLTEIQCQWNFPHKRKWEKSETYNYVIKRTPARINGCSNQLLNGWKKVSEVKGRMKQLSVRIFIIFSCWNANKTINIPTWLESSLYHYLWTISSVIDKVVFSRGFFGGAYLQNLKF